VHFIPSCEIPSFCATDASSHTGNARLEPHIGNVHLLTTPAMFTLCARVIAGLVAVMLLPAFAVRAFCNLLIRYQDESPDIGAFADALTMHVDDDVDEAIRQSRTAARVALSAVHSAVFEPLTYHSTPLPYTNPACRAALTCTTNARW